MKTVCMDVFAFDELNDDAKEKAREWYREASAGDGFYAECVIDDAKECLKFAGWDVSKVYYSGFWSQGDGACFEGSWSAANVSADRMKEHAPQDAELHRIASELAAVATKYPAASGGVKQRGHYMHEQCTAFAFEPGDDETEEVESLVYGSPEDKAHAADINTAEESFIEASRDAMRWIYRRLESEYEFHNLDEQVDDAIRANEYTFTEDGKRFG